METDQSIESKQVITITRAALRDMINLVHTLFTLSKNPLYITQCQHNSPEIARFNPNHDSVLMGYDFHLSPSGPKLIEVNNNAGGLWLAWQAHYPNSKGFSGKLYDKLLAMFLHEYTLWCGKQNTKPRSIAIIDDNPTTQFLYAEMQAFAAIFNAAHIATFILDPTELTVTAQGLSFKDTPIDLIYNRHCDFYLHSPALTAIRNAWLARQVCLTPNPHTYALLADKQRMADWTNPENLHALNIPPHAQHLMAQLIPQTHLLATQPREQIWQQRKQWVFKPTTAYASRGVYLGKKITTTKFAELDDTATIVQTYIPPSQIIAANDQAYKVDIRLFAYQQHIISVAARLYQGQVTNLRTEGGGFANIKIV